MLPKCQGQDNCMFCCGIFLDRKISQQGKYFLISSKISQVFLLLQSPSVFFVYRQIKSVLKPNEAPLDFVVLDGQIKNAGPRSHSETWQLMVKLEIQIPKGSCASYSDFLLLILSG